MEVSRPRIILSAAMSVDGKIATVSNDSKLSSKRDKIRVHELRSSVDAILVGRNTIIRDDPLLTVRLVKGSNPTRIILASSGRIPQTCKILKTCHVVPTMIVVSKRISERRLGMLKKFPVDIVTAGTKSVSLRMLMKALAKRKIATVLVEGGGAINWAFIKAGLFDELYLTISPYLVGGTDAVSLVQGDGFATIKKSAKLSLNSVIRMDDYLVLHYVAKM